MRFLALFLVLPICAFAHKHSVELPVSIENKAHHKAEAFIEGGHMYICFDEKFFIHNPDCPCQNLAKFLTFDVDEYGQPIESTRKITYRVHSLWEPH